MLSWAPLSKKKDGFIDSNDSVTLGTRGLISFNHIALSNPLFTKDMGLDIAGLTTTTNTMPSGVPDVIENARLVNLSVTNIPTALQASAKAGIPVDTFAARQSACEASGNGDQFDHLSNLAGTQDPSSNMRCGWVYNDNNPANGRGAYGTMDGPFQTSAKGQWMWDLKAAEKKYHTQICAEAKNCQDIDASRYGGRCGWDKLAGKAVPIKNRLVAYPNDPRLSCSSANLVSSGSTCPPPPPPSVIIDDRGNSVTVQTPASICTPLANGHLSRSCIIQKVQDSGCSDKGTLVSALRGGSDSNYLDQLSRSKAYTTYQTRATTPLDETSLRSGGYQTTAAALNDFQRVNDLATSSANQNNGLGYAARDLCFKQGELDTFDFCTELLDSTPPPFDLSCIQVAFLRAGGQRTGTQYPTSANHSTWNKLSNWKAVKGMINELLAKARAEGFMSPQLDSDKRAAQEQSMLDAYGIDLEPKSGIPPASITGTPVTGRENGTANISCGSRTIKNVEYVYGANGTYQTKTLTPDQCVGNRSCSTVVNNGLLGDPTPGLVKNFTVTPYCNESNTLMRARSVTGPENGTANINCGSGTIAQVEYKYGKNDKYTTQTLAPLNCVGRQSCSTDVNNGLLGDPNPGVFKDFTATPICDMPYTYKGCWGDNGIPNGPNVGRAIPNRLNNVGSIDECYRQAKTQGYDTFGSQYYGECWGGKSSELKTADPRNPLWKRYGALPESTCGDLGTAHNNKVFKIVR